MKPSMKLIPVADHDDSASSEGLSTPEITRDDPPTPLSIEIPNKSFKPLIGTPFLTSSNAVYEYPFPTTPSPSRPPLSNTSSSSSISSVHGPPSSASIDKHIPHLFARFTTRSHTHRRASSAGGLPSIPIPPRLRKFSSGPTRSVRPDASASIGLATRPGASGGEPARGQFTLSKPPSAPGSRKSWVMSARELGPALSSTPRTCNPLDSDDERGPVGRGDSSLNIAHLGLKGF